MSCNSYKYKYQRVSEFRSFLREGPLESYEDSNDLIRSLGTTRLIELKSGLFCKKKGSNSIYIISVMTEFSPNIKFLEVSNNLPVGGWRTFEDIEKTLSDEVKLKLLYFIDLL